MPAGSSRRRPRHGNRPCRDGSSPSSMQHNILAPVFQGEHAAGLAVEYRNPSGTIVPIQQLGTRPAGAMSDTLRLGDNGWEAAFTPSAVGAAGVPASEQGLAVLAVGLLVSMLLFLLIQLLSRSRSRALDLVDERTRELEHQAFHDGLTGLPNRTLDLRSRKTDAGSRRERPPARRRAGDRPRRLQAHQRLIRPRRRRRAASRRGCTLRGHYEGIGQHRALRR